MQTFETAAIISLIDRLSGPLNTLVGKVATTQNTMAAAGKRMGEIGMSMTMGFSIPAAIGLDHLVKKAAELSSIHNTLDGVLKRHAATQNLINRAADDFVKSQEQIISNAEKIAYKNSGGMMSVTEYRKATMQGVKANFDAEGAAALGAVSNTLALADKISQSDAADMLINIGNAFGIVTKNADGTRKSFEDMSVSFSRYADLLAAMPHNANMSPADAAEALKLTAPLAKISKTDPAFLAVIIEAMAESGFKGSMAGVAGRSYLQDIIAPKSTAYASLKEHGLDMDKFRTFEGMSPQNLVQFMHDHGVKLSAANAREAFKKATGPDGQVRFGDLQSGVPQYLYGSGPKPKQIRPDIAQKYMQSYGSANLKDFDVMSFTMELSKANMSAGVLANLFQGRQIPRLLAFLQSQGAGQNSPLANSLQRMFGDDYENVLKRDQAMRKSGKVAQADAYLGSAAAMASSNTEGMAGSLTRFAASMDYLEKTIYESGALDIVSDDLRHLADALDGLSAHPGALKAVIDGLMGLMVLGPALILLGAFTRGLAGLMKVFSIGTGVAEAAAAAVAGRAALGAGAAALAGGEGAAAAEAALAGVAGIEGLEGLALALSAPGLIVGIAALVGLSVAIQNWPAIMDAAKAALLSFEAGLDAIDKAKTTNPTVPPMDNAASWARKLGIANGANDNAYPFISRQPNADIMKAFASPLGQYANPLHTGAPGTTPFSLNGNVPPAVAIGAPQGDAMRIASNNQIGLSKLIEGAAASIGEGLKYLFSPSDKYKAAHPLEAPPGFGGNQLDKSNIINLQTYLKDLEASKKPQDVNVQGDVQGSVELMNRIIVEPSPLLLSKIDAAQNTNVPIKGNLGSSIGGSNGAKPVRGIGHA